MAYQDFGTYTEVDPNSRIAVVTRRVTWTGLTMNEDAYVYADKGVNYFAADFVHQLTVHLSAYANTVRGHFWALTNILDDLWGIDTANGDYLTLRLEWNDPLLTFRLQECDAGTTYESGTITILEDTTYYVTIDRDESVGTYGTLYLSIWSDASRSTQVGTTQSLALHTSKKDFRYVHGIISFDNNATTYTMSGYTENLDLDAAITPRVTTQACTSIASTTATGHGTIEDLGISAVSQHGHCWAIAINPTTADSKTTNGVGSLGAFTSSITGLSAGQRYYVRAYATNGAGTSYGANVSFIANIPSTQYQAGEIFITGDDFRYVDADGVERDQDGVAV